MKPSIRLLSRSLSSYVAASKSQPCRNHPPRQWDSVCVGVVDLESGTLIGSRVAVPGAALEAQVMVARVSNFHAAQGQHNIAMAVAAVSVRTAAIDVGLEATSSLFRSFCSKTVVFRVAAALGNIQARIAFEATLRHSEEGNV